MFSTFEQKTCDSIISRSSLFKKKTLDPALIFIKKNDSNLVIAKNIYL